MNIGDLSRAAVSLEFTKSHQRPRFCYRGVTTDGIDMRLSRSGSARFKVGRTSCPNQSTRAPRRTLLTSSARRNPDAPDRAACSALATAGTSSAILRIVAALTSVGVGSRSSTFRSAAFTVSQSFVANASAGLRATSAARKVADATRILTGSMHSPVGQ